MPRQHIQVPRFTRPAAPRRAGLLAFATAALLSAGGAKAADHDTGRKAAAFQGVLDCRALTDSAARLACYDKAAAAMDVAEAHGDIVVIDRAQASAAHREAFGLHVPSLDFMTKALTPGEADSIDGVVRGVRNDGYGKWTITLEDGAVWRQIDGILLRDPHAGSKVRIRKGSLGSFLMKIDGQAAIKVHRDA